ncbi:MAG: HlyD family efflux transporter periplasmic adaptor subunit [Pirellulaceae bacterium]|nr:HlyD family efflux transporter periplasmic adaptor subunit [Pirellulaceae bacterium]
MKTRLIVPLAVLAGLGVGALWLQAQTTSPKLPPARAAEVGEPPASTYANPAAPPALGGPSVFSPPASKAAPAAPPSTTAPRLPGTGAPGSAPGSSPMGTAPYGTRPITPVSAGPALSLPKKTIEVPDSLVTLIDDVRVPAQEAGQIMKVHVKGMEQVEAGHVLIEIDNRDALAKKLIADGEVAVAQVQADSTAEIEVAQKGVEVSKAEYDANKEIRDKNPGAVSNTELRKFLFQWQRAEAQVKVADTDHQVAVLTTAVKSAQAKAAENELARRQAAAPFKGEVNEVFRQVGEWVQPGDPLVHLVRFDRVRVKGFVYAKSASPTDVIGKPVEIKVQTAGGKQVVVKGKVDFASSIIEGVGDTRQFRIWCDVENHKTTDPITKAESWAIQSGASAAITIDVTPPPPAKIETRKPATELKKPEPKDR